MRCLACGQETLDGETIEAGFAALTHQVLQQQRALSPAEIRYLRKELRLGPAQRLGISAEYGHREPAPVVLKLSTSPPAPEQLPPAAPAANASEHWNRRPMLPLTPETAAEVLKLLGSEDFKVRQHPETAAVQVIVPFEGGFASGSFRTSRTAVHLAFALGELHKDEHKGLTYLPSPWNHCDQATYDSNTPRHYPSRD